MRLSHIPHVLFAVCVCVCVEFLSSHSACTALDSMVQMGNRKLNMCHAITPAHMHTWTHTNPVTVETNVESASLEEWKASEVAAPVGVTCAQVKLM